MMRFLVIAVLAAITGSAAARADVLSAYYTLNGTGVNDGFTDDITSTQFARFNPALGTLNSISIAFAGTATTTYFGKIQSVSALTDPSVNYNFNFAGFGGATFPFSFDTSSSEGLVNFTGTGTQALVLGFLLPIGGTITTTNTSGMLTYSYTPSAVAVTPEPSSIALLATGLLGIAWVTRKRIASL